MPFMPPWTVFFDARSVNRGLRYFEQGRVVLRDFQPGDFDGDFRFDADVRGTHRYLVSLEVTDPTLSPDGVDYENIEGNCTCPVGDFCKHQVAVLAAIEVKACSGQFDTIGFFEDSAPTGPQPLATAAAELRFVDAPTQEQNDQVRRAGWLQALAGLGADQDGSNTGTSASGRLLYGLSVRTGWGNGLHLELWKQNRTKRGWGAITRLSHQPDRLLRQNPKYLDPSDRRILEDCARLGMGSWQFSGDIFTGAVGEAILEALLATGRCHWKGDHRMMPVRRGEERPLQWTWQVEDGAISCQVVDDDNLMLIDHVWYRDLDQGLIGRTTGGQQDRERLRLVRRMPPLPAAELASSLPAIRQALPDLPEPPVVAVPEPATPEPMLHVVSSTIEIFSHRYEPPWARPVEAAVAGFRYGGDLYRPFAGPEKLPDGRLRDLAHERQLLEGLTTAGLTRVTENQAFSVHLPDPTMQRHTWIHWPEGLKPRCKPHRRPEAFPLAPAALLEAQARGWQIEGDAEPAEVVAVDTVDAEIVEAEDNDWFQLHLGIRVGDTPVDLLPLLRTIVRHGEEAFAQWDVIVADGEEHVLVPAGPGTLGRVPKRLVQGIAEHLIEIHDTTGGDTPEQLAPERAVALEATPGLRLHGGERVRAFAQRLRAGPEDAPATIPGLQAELRHYQADGVAWLQHIGRLGREYPGSGSLGGVLADDMGLGKTLQTLAHLLLEKTEDRLRDPALVVAPVSVLGTWQREAERFTPDLRVAIMHGSERGQVREQVAEHDLVITSYATLTRDVDALADQRFSWVICDEAQAIKNAATKSAEAIRSLAANHRLALTGTPLENHLGELWSLMHWLTPGLLGSQDRFNALFRNPIEQRGERERHRQLQRRVAPFLLRRTKDAVVADLPPKTEIPTTVEMGDQQRALYESVRAAMDRKVRDAIAAKGLARSHILLLEALLRLRQVCCDPRLLKTKAGRTCTGSAKMERLLELLPSLIEDGRRILLFSSFTSMLDLIAEACDDAGIAYEKLTGKTRKRQERIDRFQAGEVPLFLISLKAGGTGLTLTAADVVIHYDPWWNPAAERQATDRAHRIGQDKPVFVYKLITAGSVEDRICTLQASKQALLDGLFDDSGQSSGRIAEDDVEALLAPLDEA